MRILDQLAGMKGVFGPDAARRTAALLVRLGRMRIRDPQDLIRLHETVLFLRAYPQSPRVVRLADAFLRDFAARLKGLDVLAFEAAEVSGIAGTAISTNFSYPFVRSLAARHPGAVRIDWENYAHPDRLGAALARQVPAVFEDWSVGAHIDTRRWFTALRGNLRWLLDRIDPATYDLLEIPLLWNFGSSKAARSRARFPRRSIFYHDEPLIERRDVSLDKELAGPRIPTRRIGAAEAQRTIGLIIDTSAVRFRELWGFLYPDVKRIEHADLGRGVDLIWFGVPPQWRLPLRAYHCGMFFKNGVPLGYIETLSLFERAEIGFNLYYTFREGETAWLYARLLRFCRQKLGVTCFSVDPYQLGHENEEAIESGAFWFYRKLGFTPAAGPVADLACREEEKIAARPGYRTPAWILRRLAQSPLFYGNRAGWERFSLNALGERIGRDKPWPSILARAESEVSLRDLLRAKHGADEVRYLRLLQRAPKLRRAVLRMGRAQAASGAVRRQ
jgi:hypothetical protein